MIAYKATYNFKCRNQTYQIGKTYTSDKLKICEHGFHFCQKMADVLEYYNPTKNFVLLEIEVLGRVETATNKSVTDKFRVIRVIPFEKYTDDMKSRFSKIEYDERNNLISETCSYGLKFTFEYDEKNNCISETCSNGDKFTFEYDEKNNRISKTCPNGREFTYEYDEKNNRISKTCSYGRKTTYEYDEKNNCISRTCSDCRKYTYEYDERNNLISQTYPDVNKFTYEYANVIEE